MSSAFGLCRVLTFRWAALLLLGGVGVLLPKSGWASCGDHLAIPGHEHVSARRLQRETSPAEMPQRPCQGPHCRQAPSPTAPTTPVRIERHVELWAFIPNQDGVTLSQGNSPIVAPLLSAGAAHPLSIDRPPC